MAPKMGTFADDFVLPGLDRSKWQVTALGTSGTVTFPSGGGMVLYPAASGQYTNITSHGEYDMTESQVFIQLGGGGIKLTNTAAEAAFTLKRDATSYSSTIIVYYSSGWKIQARMYDNSGDPVVLAGTVTAAWNAARMKYWRQRRDKAGTHFWEYSADGNNWTQLARISDTSVMTLMRVFLSAGDGATAGQYFNIRRMNTRKDINRGNGYLNDTFDTYPLMSIPTYSTTPPEQFGPWKLKTGTAGINAVPTTDSPADRVLSLVGATGSTGTIISSNGNTLQDVDFTATIRIHSVSTSPSIKIMWRSNDAQTLYWYLKSTATQTSLGYVSSGSETNVATWTTNIGTGNYRTFRVIHVGSEPVIFIDDPGLPGYPTVELLPRVAANANIVAAGLVGFKSLSQTTYIKDVVVSNGIMPPSGSTAPPLDQVQIKPWVGDRTSPASNIEYMRFEDQFGNVLNIMPSYGDIMLRDADLGTPVARPVIKQRSGANGAISYTQFHGEKPVALSLTVYKTYWNEAQFYSDAIQRWARPGFRFKLIYKPRGAGERYINVEGSTLGRSVITRIGNQRIELDVALLAVDGGDYETNTQTLLIQTPGEVRYIVSYGTLPTEPMIRIYGPCSNPIIYNQTIESYNPDTFARLGLTVDLDAYEFVDLDTKNREVRYMGLPDESANYRQFLTTRAWFVFEPGANGLFLTSDDVAGWARIQWADKY